MMSDLQGQTIAIKIANINRIGVGKDFAKPCRFSILMHASWQQAHNVPDVCFDTSHMFTPFILDTITDFLVILCSHTNSSPLQ